MALRINLKLTADADKCQESGCLTFFIVLCAEASSRSGHSKQIALREELESSAKS
jgi:hypothetical protein